MTIAAIKDRNAEFEKLPAAERRVAIAKDVIAQIAAKQLVAKVGIYEELLPDTGCGVCALGALFVCSAGQEKVFNSWKRPRRWSHLQRHFSERQLVLIEEAFEGWGTPARGYYARFKDDESRLLAIMENIIKNAGTFVLPEDV